MFSSKPADTISVYTEQHRQQMTAEDELTTQGGMQKTHHDSKT